MPLEQPFARRWTSQSGRKSTSGSLAGGVYRRITATRILLCSTVVQDRILAFCLVVGRVVFWFTTSVTGVSRHGGLMSPDIRN